MRLIELLFLMFLVSLSFGCREITNEVCLIEEKNDTHDFSGLKAYKNIDDAVSCSSDRNLPIFIVFTGYGCVSVSRIRFEEKLFSNRKVRNIITDKFIPVVLYVDDRKKLKEIQVSIRNGKEHKLRTIGNVNSEYQMWKFQKNSQPLLAILDHNGDQIISQMGYAEGRNRYYHFLRDGFEMYQELGDNGSNDIRE